jgi:hypothetical protein
VHNVQGGKDDCEEYSVQKYQLNQLLSVCKGVLSGGLVLDDATLLDETFKAHVEYTQERLEILLEQLDDVEFADLEFF